METEIEKIVNRNRIVMSSVPTWAKELFLVRSQEEFGDHHGSCLAALLKDSAEYNKLKEMFFNNEMNVQLLLNSSQAESEIETEVKVKEEVNSIRLGNGKTIEYKGGKKR